MKKYKKIMILIIVISILASVCLTAFMVLYSLPKGCVCLNVKIGTAKVGEEINWQNGALEFTTVKEKGTLQYMKNISMLLKTVRYGDMDDSLLDVQCVEFDFANENVSVKKYIFAYDFYTKKIYGLKNGKWFLIEENEKLNNVIVDMLDSGYHFDWLGQSTYIQGDHFGELELPKQMTFRYDMYWRSDEEKRGKTGRGFYDDEAWSIVDAEDAFNCAAKKLGVKAPMGFVFYDETCGYWLVEVMEDVGYDVSSEEFKTIAFEDVYSIVIDENGSIVEAHRTNGGSTYQFFLQGKAMKAE